MRSALLRLLRGSLLPLFGLGVFLTYRWAEHAPSAPDPVVRNAAGRVVVVRLDNAPFTAYSEGRKTWSLHAAQIDLERLPGAAFSNIESASLTDIKQGVLYRLPVSAFSFHFLQGFRCRRPLFRPFRPLRAGPQ